MTARLNGQALPDGWVWTQMDFVCQKVQDGTHFSPQVQYEQSGPGRYLYITAKNVRYGRLDLSNITYIDRDEHESIFERCNPEEGDILLTKDGVNTGVAAINHVVEPFSLLSSVALLKPHRDILDSRFLMHYLHSPIGSEMITGQMTGTAIKRIILRRIKEAPICVAPLNEQHRIVAAIETQFTRLDAAVTALKRSQANLKRYRAAVLKAACEGRLVPTEAALAQAEGRSYEPAAVLLERILSERRRKWEAENPKKKYQEPVAPDRSGLPELPEGWCWVSLDIIAQVRTGVAKGRKFDNQHVVSLPYLRVANVQDGYLDLFEIKTIEILANEIERYRLKPHDILFNEGGDRDKLGRGAIWLGDIQDCIHQNHVFAARLYTSNIEPKWVNFTRQLTYARDHFWKQASQTTNLASINSTNLRSLPIPVPPHDEQVRIIAEVERRLSLIDQLEKTIKTDLARANRLRQSILKRAFAGQLVPQDPNDEPASVLLAQIRQP